MYVCVCHVPVSWQSLFAHQRTQTWVFSGPAWDQSPPEETKAIEELPIAHILEVLEPPKEQGAFKRGKNPMPRTSTEDSIVVEG